MIIKLRNLEEWRPWFAWRPVFIAHGEGCAIVWLRWLECAVPESSTMGLWEYRLPEEDTDGQVN